MDASMLHCRPFPDKAQSLPMLELGTKFLLSYFIGSVMGSMVMGRLFGGVDIRTMGSGNAGGTNALRTQGWVFALGVMIIDVGKGVLGTAVVPVLDLPFIGTSADVSREWLTVTCAAAAVIGHVWPVWHEFRGGKGAATLVGTLGVLQSGLLLPVLGVWLLVLLFTGYVGLSTVVAGIAAPLYVGIVRLPEDQSIFIYCAAMAMYLVFSHRSNIMRMLAGEEHRLSRVLLIRKGRGQ
jgi:glycerol-3-phosphate acyltransferase PlsY